MNYEIVARHGSLVDLQLTTLKLLYSLSGVASHKGFGRLTRALGSRFFSTSNSVDLRVHSRSKFRVWLNDPYWVLLLTDNQRYEPEVEFVFDKLITSDTAFLDCGANQGYWSLLAAERIEDPARVIAVEASQSTRALLEANRDLSEAGFTILHNALSDASGEQVEFITAAGNHAGASVAGAKERVGTVELQRESVETVCIDDIVKKNLARFSGPVVIKLDVEGQEIPGLRGARETLSSREVVISYEDLPLGEEQDVSKFVCEELGLALYYVPPGTEQVFRADDLEELEAIRQRFFASTMNFVAATRGSCFEQKLDSLRS